jgi:hypothetical protein
LALHGNAADLEGSLPRVLGKLPTRQALFAFSLQAGPHDLVRALRIVK